MCAYVCGVCVHCMCVCMRVCTARAPVCSCACTAKRKRRADWFWLSGLTFPVLILTSTVFQASGFQIRRGNIPKASKNERLATLMLDVLSFQTCFPSTQV